jgi:transposase
MGWPKGKRRPYQRRRAVTTREVREMRECREQGLSLRKIALATGRSRPTVARYVGEDDGAAGG